MYISTHLFPRFNHAANYRGNRVDKGPIFPDHDMEITFDTDIPLKEMEQINHLRGLISQTLSSQEIHRLTRSNADAAAMQVRGRDAGFHFSDSWPDRGRIPVELGEIPYVRRFDHQPSPPSCLS